MTQGRKIDEWAEAGKVSSVIITLENDKGEKRAALVMLEDLPLFIRGNYEKHIHQYGRLIYSYGRDAQEGTRTPEKDRHPGELWGDTVIRSNSEEGESPDPAGATLEPNSP